MEFLFNLILKKLDYFCIRSVEKVLGNIILCLELEVRRAAPVPMADFEASVQISE